MRRSHEDFEGHFVVCIDNPGSFRGGAVLPVEGDRWQVTLAGVHGDAPPGTDEGVGAFAASLSTPAVGQLIARCERLSDIATYRFPSSQRRHYEKVRDLLPGLVMLGDASSSFDPIYGQGMTSSALQAAALAETVSRVGVAAADLPSALPPQGCSHHRRSVAHRRRRGLRPPCDRGSEAAGHGAAQRLRAAGGAGVALLGARRAVLQPGAPAQPTRRQRSRTRRSSLGCCGRRGARPSRPEPRCVTLAWALAAHLTSVWQPWPGGRPPGSRMGRTASWVGGGRGARPPRRTAYVGGRRHRPERGHRC